MKPEISLTPMTPEMYHAYFRNYQNDPDLYLDKTKYTDYVYDPARVDQYIRRQIERGRKCFAIMHGGDMVGELIIKDIEPHKCATLGICMRNASCKDRGFGTRAERLAVEYVFRELDIPVLYADCILSNTRSQHVLEKVGFRYIRTEGDFKYYCMEKSLWTAQAVG